MRRLWQLIKRGIGQILDVQIGIEERANPIDTLYHRSMPPRLGLNWLALILGPLWYLLTGLWVHASILLGIVFLSGGLLAPFVWLYCGLKANEDLLEIRLARRSFY